MSKESHPLVSIVIPVYNGANYMREAIDSALAQTYPNIEILVVNDGSTDNGATHDIAMSYGEKIRYFKKENGGVVSALNFGIKNMRGEYFAWLSHDDLYLPKKIEKQVLALEKHKGTRPAFCICNCKFIDENGKDTHIRSYVRQDCAFDKPRCFLFLENIGFNGIMVLIPKILFDICGGFTPSLATHEYDMWLRIMEIADVVVETECLTCMRMHPNQVSSQRKKDANLEIDAFMGNGMKDIPFSEFEAFIADQVNKKGIQYIFDLFNSYMWYQDFPITSFQILKKFRLLFEKPNDQIDNLYSSLLGYSSIDEIKGYFTQRFHNDKPVIVIHCENLTDDVLKGMSMGIALLSMQYEIVIFYQTIEENNLQLLGNVNITAIKLMYHLDFNMPLCLALLSYLLNAKMFWYYSADNRMPYSKTFHFLRLMDIYSIASFQDIDNAFLNSQDQYNMDYIDQKKHLAKASLITSRIAPTMSGTFSIITVPEDAFQALVRWKMIFDVLLTTNESCELKKKISNDLSAILEKSHNSKPSETENAVGNDLTTIIEDPQISFSNYVNNYIRDFLVNVDNKALALAISYEQRRFWKLTKPLRSTVWFFRKAIKAIKLILNRKKSIRDVIYHLRMMLKNRRISV